MRISFVWDWEPEYYQSVTWEDGLAAALRELINRGHEVQILCAGNLDSFIGHPYFQIIETSNVTGLVKLFKPDVILHWGDTTRPNAAPTAALGIPMALCFAGGEMNGGSERYFQHIFVESEVYKPGFIRKGIPVSTAFGTNTELFKPMPEQPKYFDTIFPATFALWKRHELYAQATKGLRSLACGYMYTDHEQECWQICLDNGVMVLPHVSAQSLRHLYAASKVCVIPSRSDGGSQRTVLEAMAMNLPVIVADSDKYDFAEGKVFQAEPYIQDIRTMINMALGSEVSTRDYIVANWSERNYADALEKGLESIAR
jgi:glycosyltransferase involved in cell wall biosynthesis